MQIETYEQPELTQVEDADRAEFSRITEQLGLVKQLAFASEGAINPFRHMSESEKRVYTELLSTRTAVEDFDAQAIPLRVLKILEFAKQNSWFVKYQIWHNTQQKDPILVAYADSAWNAEPFILARWGDELESFPSLLARAIETRVHHMTAERQKALNNVRLDAVTYLAGIGY